MKSKHINQEIQEDLYTWYSVLERTAMPHAQYKLMREFIIFVYIIIIYF